MDEIPDIVRYYKRLARKFGADPRADGYSREIAREERFRAYARHIDFRNKTLLDVGCGTGAFLDWLLGHLPPGQSVKRYVGIDILPAKIRAAKKLFRDGENKNYCKGFGIDVEFIAGTVNTVLDPSHFDIAVACSIFDVKQTDAPTTWKIAQDTLEMMWSRSIVAIGADFFSPYALDIQPFNAPIPPEWVLPWALNKFGRRIILDYSYLPHDYMLVAFKGDNRFVEEWKKTGGWKRETGGERG